ncbi:MULTISPECIES: sporulation histidine kinase inhibitor Sda [Paenibacillus]|uniref:Sporulation histidine kinase inhibitor Sda n=1 Tax=Paenibacillus agilis TaxID=3020863 RepID=A0A559II37_9BACL|nr:MULTISPECIES: sporulation histidine kinase inhibitor Sda [Paenibacillus]TVX87123.1 sporulation histidine kinase inhibitor Sda [Paenibacillus agilis]
MALLSDEMLFESYSQAVRLQLDEEFIALLLAEMQRRRLRPTIPQYH